MAYNWYVSEILGATVSGQANSLMKMRLGMIIKVSKTN